MLKLKETLKNTRVKIIILIVVIVASVLAFWFGLKAVLKTDHPLIAVTSVNMEPTLKVGDLIVVQGGLDGSEIKAAPAPEGEIIVFYNPSDLSNLVVQRATDKFPRDDTCYFNTTGDHNIGSDNWEGGPDCWDVPMENVVGKVVWRVPLLGYVSLFIQWIFGTLTGMLILITLVLILALYIRRPSLRKKI